MKEFFPTLRIHTKIIPEHQLRNFTKNEKKKKSFLTFTTSGPVMNKYDVSWNKKIALMITGLYIP